MHNSCLSAIIYFVSNSAIISDDDAPGLRERKRAARWEAIVNTARDLTEAHGLAGYTVEQLCERVGISRRTFFNYFASKEDAVLGRNDDGIPSDLLEEFLARGSTTPGRISATLMEDTVTLFGEMASRMTFNAAQYRQLVGIIDREPHLQAKLFGETAQREGVFKGLLAQRENCDPDDPRIVMAAVLIGGAARQTTQIYFNADNSRSFEAILRDFIHAVPELIETSRPGIGAQS